MRRLQAGLALVTVGVSEQLPKPGEGGYVPTTVGYCRRDIVSNQIISAVRTSSRLSGFLLAILSMFKVDTTPHVGNILLTVPKRLTNIAGGFILSEI